jgi:Uma2 family endonuclease
MTVEIESELDKEEQVAVADGLSGVIGAILTSYLVQYVTTHGLGLVFNADTDFTLPGGLKRRPDIAFCSFETLPEPPRSVVPVPPDLAVEITSSRDEIDNTDKKLQEYLQAKIKLVWVIRPIAGLVEVYKEGKVIALLGSEGTLDGDPVIPGFKLSVAQLFNLPKKSSMPNQSFD